MRTPRDSIYAGHRYPAEIISYAVWLYFRFPLSLRMVEEMLAALVLAAGTLSLWAPRLMVAQTSALAVDLLDDQGDLQCRGQVGEVSYAFL